MHKTNGELSTIVFEEREAMFRKRIISAVLSAALVAQPLIANATDASVVVTDPADAQATVVISGEGDSTEAETEAESKIGYWFSDSTQLMLYEDGTYALLEGDVYQSGSWVDGDGGVTLQHNGGESAMSLQGLAHSEGTLIWRLPTLVITAGAAVQTPSLGSGFAITGGDLDTSQPGSYEAQYTVTDETIGKQFSLIRPVTINEAPKPVVIETEQTEPTTEAVTEAATEPPVEINQPETLPAQDTSEPVEIDGGQADSTEPTVEGSGFKKTFTVKTPGGTMTVTGSNGQLLATIEYGQSYTIDTVQNANDGIDDVTIGLMAADGYVVDALENLAIAGEVESAMWCPSGIGTKSFERGAYLTQLNSDEEYNAYFCQDGDFQYTDPDAIATLSISELNTAQVGSVFRGRATLVSINCAAGHEYNGTGVISCTDGVLAGHSFTMSTCASGHNAAIPLAGQTGSYKATVTGIDKSTGYISFSIYWANDYTPISNYQSLSGGGSISHPFKAKIDVNKTSSSANVHIMNSSYYSLANAEFTIYKNYDKKTDKVSGAIGKITTDANGKAVQPLEVDEGTYYMKETKAPKGFYPNDTVFTINAKAGETVARTVTEEPKYGGIEIHKVNKATGKSDERLGGTKFGIYRDAKCKDLIETVEIQVDGYGYSSDFYFLGVTYYVKEISTTARFSLNKSVQKVKITDDGKGDWDIPVKTLKFANNEKHTGLALIKCDTNTGSTATTSDEYSFKGAEYTVYSDKKCTKSVGVITLDENGYGELNGLKANTEYWFRETKAPENYELNPEIRPAYLDNPNDVTEYEVADSPVPTHFTILKVNAATNQPDERLAGTVFGVYSDYNCTNLIEEVTIDASGLATTSDKYWLGLTYYVKELKTTASWVPLVDTQAVKATNEVKVPQVNFKNDYVTRKIQLKKKPSGMAPIKDLSNAHYTIYSDEECTNVVDVMITDKDGNATSKDLPLGIYWIKETQAPEGFKIDEETHVRDLTKADAKPIYWEVYDDYDSGIITIKKFDLDTQSATPANPNYSMDGAVYTVYSDSACTTPAVAVEGENTITIKNSFGSSGWFKEGTYWVKETTAPVGYDLDTNIYQVTTSGGKAVEINSYDPLERGAIQIEKRDAVTGSTASATDAYSMDGAEYTIYSDEACTAALKTVTIKDGKAATDKEFKLGTYYVKETKAPAYYTVDTNIYKVDITAENCDAVPLVVSTDNPVRGKIAIQKADAETGKFEPLVENLTFKDAIFGIYSDKDCTDLVQQLTTDENGYAESEELVIRDYYVKEITPPKGYTKNEQVFTVSTTELKKAIDSSSIAKVVISDRIIRANITLMKHINDEQGSIIQMPGNDLEGIKFVFTYVADESIKFSITDEENTVVTDEYGHATTADLEKYPYGTLIYGTWRISEVLPSGALEPIKDIELPVEDDGVDYPYVVNNDRVTSYLQIIKVDANTGNAIPIPGVTFKIKTEANEYVKMWDYTTGKYVDQFSTDDKGEIRLPGTLRYGNYSLEEVSAPKGYKLGKPLAFSITEGNKDPLAPIKVIYKDSPQTGHVSVQKLDASTEKEAGKGFIFSITVKSDIKDHAGTIRKGKNSKGETVDLVAGTVVDVITTDEKGLATSRELYLGDYTISEVKAGDFYALEDVTVDAALTADKPDVTVKVSDRKTTFELSKVDSSDTLKILPGITFRIFSEKDIDRAKVEAYQQGLTAKRGELLEAVNSLISDNAKAVEAKKAEHAKALAECKEDEVEAMKEKQAKELEALEAEQEKALDSLRSENQKKLTQYSEENGLALDGVGTEATTDKEGYVRMQNLHHSTRYYVVETKTIDGYNLEPDVYSFDVDENGLVNGSYKYSMTITNTPNVLQISKVDATGEKELPGATLTLYNGDGATVDSWVSAEEPHVIKGLAAGTYKLEEVTAPEGYCRAESIIFELTNSTEIQKVTMKDEYTETKISKVDTKTKNPVIGAKLGLYQGEKLIAEWETNEKPYVLKGLAAGDYEVRETFTPTGYATAAPIKFTVTDKLETLELIMEDTPIKVVISKNSAELGEATELPGATLQILDSEGKEVGQWVTTAQPHEIEYMAVGDYILRELSAPDGYSKAEDVKFSVTATDRIQYVNMTDTYTRLEISKKDITGDDELPGAQLVVTDENGEVVDSWTSEDKPHMINGLKVGKYKLEEVLAPDGYTTAESVEFTVTDTLETQKVEMRDAPIKVEISKKDLTGDDELPGADLAIIDSEGNTVEEWTSGDTPHTIERLPVGEYTLRETSAPEGYTTAEEVAFTISDTTEIQKVEMRDAPTKVKISKRDITGSDELPGATLEIVDKDGKTVETWTSSDKPHVIKRLPVGEYTLRETTAPEGYTTAEEIQFSVKDTTKVQKVVMKDAPTKVEISKVDITGGEELPGATLEIKNSKGETVERWVSEDKPHLIERLPLGDYTLTEITAPDGYEIAETIKFSVTDTAEIQKVVMKDKKKDTTTTTTTTNTTTTTTNVKTGDDTPIALLITTMLLAMIAITTILRKKRTDR